MAESVKAFGIGAIGILLSYSLIAVYVLNIWLVQSRGLGTFRSLMAAEVILIALGSFGARLGFGTVRETMSPNWAAFGLTFGVLLSSYTPFLSFLTDCVWGLGAIVLGAALSRVAAIIASRT